MIILTAEFVAQSEHREAVKKHFYRLVELSRKEPGCIMYELYQDAENLDKFIFIEKWASQALLDAHLKTEHVLSLTDTLPKQLAVPLKITWLQAVDDPTLLDQD